MENNIIFKAKRVTPKNSSYQGNPLIEALFDPLSSSEYYRVLINKSPLKRSEVIKLTDDIIEQELDSIRDRFLVPNRRLYDVYDLIHSSINSSYNLRNPLKSSIRSALHKDYRDLANHFVENYQSTFSKSSLIIGVSGIGKTTAVNAASALFPPALRHKDINGETFVQVPIIKIECPKDGSIKALCRYFFIELDKKLGTHYESTYCKRRDTADERVVAMSKLVICHCIGILIVDEIQHLIQSKGGLSETMLNFFLNLDNTLHIPIIIVGTPETLYLFSETQRLRRRFTAGDSMKWDVLEKGKEWSIMIKNLFKYQYTAEIADAEIDWADILYYHSQGIIDRAVKIFVAAQKWSLTTGSRSITPEIIQKVIGKKMWLDDELFSAIRNKKHRSGRFNDMVMPIDIEEPSLNDRLNSILKKLDFLKINKSPQLIQQLVTKNPTLSDDEIAFQVIKVVNEIEDTDKKIGKRQKPKLNTQLLEEDLRKCTTDNEEHLHQQLVDLGIISKFENFMIHN